MKGYSIHIGVNKVDQKHYNGLPDLRAAENDARDMKMMAEQVFGYQSLGLFVDNDATTDKVLNAISRAGNQCDHGDILLITYSGHGGVIDDIPAAHKKFEELTDQTWCLYNRQLIDDEIFLAFSRIDKEIRILVVSDSCHSGTVTREVTLAGFSEHSTDVVKGLNKSIEDFAQSNNWVPKKVSLEKSAEILKTNLDDYRKIQQQIPVLPDKDSIKPSVLLLAACQDDEVTFDGLINGRFTTALKQALSGGKSKLFGHPDDIIDTIKQLYDYPTPNFDSYGPNAEFKEKGNPFFINPQSESVVSIGNKEFETDAKIPQSTSIQREQSKSILISMAEKKMDLKLIHQLYKDDIRSVEFDPDDHSSCTIQVKEDKNTWDEVHRISRMADELKEEVEVDIEELENYPVEDEFKIRAAGSETGFMPYWPPMGDTQSIDRNWHLADTHSQLRGAREEVYKLFKSGEISEKVRIGHLDTGWDHTHPLLRDNNNVRKDLAKSFVKGESSNKYAWDHIVGGGEQQGHGTGTIGLIVGGEINENGQNYGTLGAAYFAEVIPIRVTDSVIILKSKNIIKGIRYAMSKGCEIITMSLGGKPSRKLAKVINEAYMNGVTIVAAAGNSIVKGIANIGPKKLVYPAKYDRVIAACGACHNQLPYDFDAQKEHTMVRGLSTRFMQGNWGPKSAMKTALTAYTPNVPWLVRDPNINYVLSGGGTSSATPQIASAVALWLMKNKKSLKEKGYAGKWEQVEAVRSALFSTAKQPFDGSNKYYGNGIIQVKNALDIKVENLPELVKSKEANTSPFGIIESIDLFINRRRTIALEEIGDNERETLQKELDHIIDQLNEDELIELFESESPGEELVEELFKHRKRINEIGISRRLKEVTGL